MVTLTTEEFEQLSPEAQKKHLKDEERTVFGHGVRRDKNGSPIEVGIGAPGHETLNHWNAMRLRERAGQEEPGTTDQLMKESAARHRKPGPKPRQAATDAAS